MDVFHLSITIIMLNPMSKFPLFLNLNNQLLLFDILLSDRATLTLCRSTFHFCKIILFSGLIMKSLLI